MNSDKERADGFAMAVVVEGSLALIAIALAWLFRVPLREQFPTTGAALLAGVRRGLLATLPMLAALGILMNSSWAPLRQLCEQVQSIVHGIFPSRSVSQFAMVAALAGVGEELLFRGVVQPTLVGWTTPIIGLLLASALFGVFHALSKLYFTFAAIVGAFFGWMAIRYHDLLAPIVAHGVYDFVALAYVSQHALPGTQSVAGNPDSTGPENSIPK